MRRRDEGECAPLTRNDTSIKAPWHKQESAFMRKRRYAAKQLKKKIPLTSGYITCIQANGKLYVSLFWLCTWHMFVKLSYPCNHLSSHSNTLPASCNGSYETMCTLFPSLAHPVGRMNIAVKIVIDNQHSLSYSSTAEHNMTQKLA